jgi:16S rRNA (uracil1498-N3)-methyltransferase
VTVVNGCGVEADGVIRVEGKRATVAIESITRLEGPPAPLEVACALTKSAAFEETVQRAVELGMTHLRPLFTERSVVEFDDKRADRKMERWRRHAIEALKQCERLWLPAFSHPVGLAELLQTLEHESLHVFFLEERAPGIPHLSRLLAALSDTGCCLLIGPEGGWSEGEKAYARENGAQPASLGTRSVLRTETAWLAALALASR